MDVSPSVVDLEALERWMDAQGIGAGPISGAHLLTGGTQNILVRFTRGARDLVLRRGPINLRPKTNDHLRKEVELLRALADTDVPHPHLVGACADEHVLGGAVFYLMEPVDGYNAAVELPPSADDAAVRHDMGLRAVDALVSLSDVDHRTIGLGDHGNPDGFLERQVSRWRHQLESYDQLPGRRGSGLPGVASVGKWLEHHRPSQWTPGILHGDFHLANLMYARDSSRVAAIVDWEMSTIGDPLLDLGWLLATWPTPGELDVVDIFIGKVGGLPGRQTLIERYRDQASRSVEAVDWYMVLACYKLGIVLEGSHARAQAGLVPTDVGDLMHTRSVALLDRAREWAGL